MKHLSDEQLAGLKRRLRDRFEQLRQEIREELLRADTEQYGELAGRVHDAAEESVADLLADTNIALVGRYLGELREVEAALQRISMGSYGLCDDCEEAIPFERLQAYPTALRCLEHQQHRERMFGEQGQPKL